MGKINSDNLPSIILLSIDSLRTDHLGCYGYKRNTSPNIDNIANEGVVFTQAVSSGTSTDSSIMISILTSYVFKHNILDRMHSKIEMLKNPLSKFITLPELLKNKNYHTAFFGPSIIAFFKIFMRSFNFFYACPVYLSKNMLFPTVRNFLDKHNIRFKILNKIIFVILKKITAIILCCSKREKADFMTNQAIRWIEKNKSGPFFLWLHYLDTHAPYCPPEPLNKMFIKDGIYHTGQKLPILHIDKVYLGGIPDSIAENNITDVDYYISQYDGAIRFIDEQIGKITKYLQREGLSENTLIIITADYGEYLGENNFFTHNPFPLDEVMKIPLIMKYHKMFTHRIIDSQVQSIDIAPTILDILHIDKSQTMQGESLLSLIQYTETQHTPYAFLGGDEISVIRGNEYKLIRINQDRINKLYKKALRIPSLNISGCDKIEYLLFDLKKDPEERINLANTHKEILESLKEKLEKWLSERTYEFGKVSRL